MPRITALHMLRSIMTTISAPAVSSFRGSLPHPTQPLCTLRVRRYRRLTQHSLPGGPLRPYLGRTCTGGSRQLLLAPSINDRIAMLQIDPLVKAAECERVIRVLADPDRRSVLLS